MIDGSRLCSPCWSLRASACAHGIGEHGFAEDEINKLEAAPHYATYTNALGAGRAGYYFPHDEFYDDGLREAIRYVCEHAPERAAIVHETPAVARYYLQKFNRTDLDSRVLSDSSFQLDDAPRPAYIILQRGRTYFENREKMDETRAHGQKVYEGFAGGLSAVEVYELK